MEAKRLGILSAITASLCCLGPAVLVPLGLVGLAGLFGRFSLLWIGLGIGVLAWGWKVYLAEGRRCRQAQCRMPGRLTTLAALVGASTIVAAFALIHGWPLLNKAACAIACAR